MAGTREGGLKTARKNVELYGKDFYANIGRKGGKAGTTGGFAANPEKAKLAGSIGGKRSSRKPNVWWVVIDNTVKSIQERKDSLMAKYGYKNIYHTEEEALKYLRGL